jgi:ABC-type Mn2+/Zn2+ transport system permease subunit
MTARTPPTPDGERSTAEPFSSSRSAADVRSDSAGRIVALAYITAVTMPFVGLILGTAVLIRPTKASSKHGAWIIAISVIASVVWILIITSGAVKLTTNDINS